MQQLVETIKAEHPLDQHRFFQWIERCPIEQFQASQQDFYHAVIHFGRPMMRLAARLDSYAERWSVLENIIEEHGSGELEHTHGASFRTFLRSLSPSCEPFAAPSTVVSTFNQFLDQAVAKESPAYALAVFAIIEDRFAEISARIGRTVVARGWVPSAQLQHYDIHAELDIEHAQGFYQLLQSRWAEQSTDISRGLYDGNEVFLGLYAGLEQCYA